MAYVKDIFLNLTILENLQLANTYNLGEDLLVALFNGWDDTELNITTVKAGELSGGQRKTLMNLMTFLT